MTQILDCTARDGGYLNSWKFSDNEIFSLIECDKKIGISFFEIGYRSNKQESKFLSCSNEDVSKFVQDGIEFLVMLNVCDFEDNLIEQNPKIKNIRVASHSWELEKAISICEKLLDGKYNVFLHIMNIKELTKNDFDILENWKRKSEIISLYFADSYGSFFPDDVEFFYNKIKTCGYEKISFHAHNNIQTAFINSLKAIQLGAFSIDATLSGKGRGGGNLPLELILTYLNRVNIKEIFETYSPILDKNSLFAFKNIIGGVENLHPKEIEKFLSH